MSRRSTGVLKTALRMVHASGAGRLAAPVTRGMGAILMLHHVAPQSPEAFEPNRILRVSPEFLNESIESVRAAGFDTVSLDEAYRRMTSGQPERRFIAYTLDDGYRDNLEHAWPVFKAHEVPFAIYLPDAFADGSGDLWWLKLERLFRDATRISAPVCGAEKTFDLTGTDARYAAYHEVYWWLRTLDEDAARAWISSSVEAAGLDEPALCRDLIMTWDEVRSLAADPLVTIGGHTRGHYALAKLDDARMRDEVISNMDRLEAELGARPAHFSYPYGGEEAAGPREFAFLKSLGVKTAVTTRKGMIYRPHTGHLTALPRVSLNGDFQSRRELDALLTGLPLLLFNKGRRLNVA